MRNSLRSACGRGAAVLLVLTAACVGNPAPTGSLAAILARKTGTDNSLSQTGGGGQLSVGVGDAQNALLGLAAYTRLNFEGGHDQVLNFGGQYRRYFSLPKAGGPWIGAEATYMKEKSVLESGTGDPSATGFTAGAVFGYRLPIGGINLSLLGGVSYFKIGDFTLDGEFAWSGSNHMLFRGGLEVLIR